MKKKYVLIEEQKYFNLWLNTKNNCKECYWKDEDPNTIVQHEEEVIINRIAGARKGAAVREAKNYKKVQIVF